MRLYRIDRRSEPGSMWAGTQANARQLSKETGKPWATVEVPTDKAGLLGFLNLEGTVATETSRLNAELAAPVELSREEIINSNTPEAQAAARRMMNPERDFTFAEIEAFILDRASVAQVGKIMECLGTRFAELIKEKR